MGVAVLVWFHSIPHGESLDSRNDLSTILNRPHETLHAV